MQTTLTVEEALQQAIAHHQAGRLADAEQLYRSILQAQPAHPDANHNLGVIAVQVGQPAAALSYLKLALETQPGQAQFWISYVDALLLSGRRDEARDVLEQGKQRGLQGAPVAALTARLNGSPSAMPDTQALQTLVALYNAGRYAELVSRAQEITERHPAFGGGWKTLGTALQAMQRSAEALEPMQRAVALSPGDAEAQTNLGNTLKALGRLDEAIASYQRAVQIDSAYGLAFYNLASALCDAGRLAEAEASYRRAIALLPGMAEAHNNLGAVLEQLGCLGEARDCYQRAVELNPDYAEAHNNLGALLKDSDQQHEAEMLYRRAIALKPDFTQAHCNLGVVLKNLARHDEAVASYRRALELDPNHAAAHYNLAWTLKVMHRAVEAEAGYRRALALKPDYAEARGNLAMVLLQQGRYVEGWPEYEARYDPGRKDRKTAPPPTLPDGPPLPPQWQGESLAGKRLLIWPEQGLGDEIQFVRFLPLLRERGASRIVLVCKPPLADLFSAQQLADEVIDASQWQPQRAAEFDVWSYVMSLPLHCGITLDNLPTPPYLQPDPARRPQWRAKLPQGRPRIGLVWKGRPTHDNDAQRSLPSLAALRPLWSIPGMAFVSLQKGAGEDEAASPPEGQDILALGREMADFADGAAVLAELDLLICVDTAMAHLAGALGTPCWLLLPQRDTDWRWLEGRSDSPWYPGTMRLFRQTAEDDGWTPVVQRLAEALHEWKRGRSA
jgi:tetratricopeptide (TPR) repeat protein